VKTPAQTAEQITQLAQRAGGFLVTSNVNGGADATSASLTLRVPAEKFDEVRVQIRKLALRVENESIERRTLPSNTSISKRGCAICGRKNSSISASCARLRL
jgi:hypothetical protein